MTPDLGDPFSTGNQAYDERALKLNELTRDRNPRNDGNICGPDATLGEIDRSWRLRCTANAQYHNICFLEIFDTLAVIMGHGEIDRVDTPEIVGVESMLPANLRPRRCIEILRKGGDDRIEDGQARNTHQLALRLELGAQFRIDKCEQHDAGLFLNLAQGAVELGGRPDQCIDMCNGAEVGILRCGGLGNRVEGLSRGVRNEMEVEKPLRERLCQCCGSHVEDIDNFMNRSSILPLIGSGIHSLMQDDPASSGVWKSIQVGAVRKPWQRLNLAH